MTSALFFPKNPNSTLQHTTDTLLTYSFKDLPLPARYNYISENTVFSVMACNDIIHSGYHITPTFALSKVSPLALLATQEPSNVANVLKAHNLSFLDFTDAWEGLQNPRFSFCSSDFKYPFFFLA